MVLAMDRVHEILAECFADDLPVGAHMISWSDEKIREYADKGGFFTLEDKNVPAQASNDGLRFFEHQPVLYCRADGTTEAATVVKVHDDDVEPYYTIRVGGVERSTVSSRLSFAPASHNNGSIVRSDDAAMAHALQHLLLVEAFVPTPAPAGPMIPDAMLPALPVPSTSAEGTRLTALMSDSWAVQSCELLSVHEPAAEPGWSGIAAAVIALRWCHATGARLGAGGLTRLPSQLDRLPRLPTQFEFFECYVRGRSRRTDLSHLGLSSCMSLPEYKQLLSVAAADHALPAADHAKEIDAEPVRVQLIDGACGREALEISLTSELITLEHCADGVLLLRHAALADRLRVQVFSVLGGVAIEAGEPWLLLLRVATSELGGEHEWLPLSVVLDRLCEPGPGGECGGFVLLARRPLN